MSPEMILGENRAWGSGIVDMAHPQWSAAVIGRVRKLKEQGYDGLFLDTLDSYMALPIGAEGRESQRKALVALIRLVHEAFPEGKLIFNRGFEILPEAGGYMDGLAAESLYYGWDQANGRYKEVAKADRQWLLDVLLKVKSEYGIPVIVIDYLPPEKRDLARKAAKDILSHGFTPWVATPGLDYAGVGAIEPYPRRVLAVYDASEHPVLEFSPVHRAVTAPLEHMGFIVEYAGTAKSLPGYELLGRYAGIVAWFDGSGLEDPEKYHNWLLRQLKSGVPVAVFGDMGIVPDSELLAAFGITPVTAAPVKPLEIEINRDMIGFEAPVILRSRNMPRYVVADGAVSRLFSLRDAAGNVFDLIFTGQWGGMALNPYVYQPALDNETRWALDPFRFLSRALGRTMIPVPDVTTENGMRLLMTHIDGDGAVTESEFPGHPLAIEVIRDAILKKYPVPATVSVIEGETAPYGLYPSRSARAEEAAKDIFKLPHVEIASHTFSHPFVWPGKLTDMEGAGSRRYHLDIPGYEFDISREIDGSIDYINARLAPPGKLAKVVLWSGNALPGAEAVSLAGKRGVLNMNGGGATITNNNKTLMRVPGMGRKVGSQYQVYAPVMNENVYTNEWKGPYFGFKNVIETFGLTDMPRRLKPIDIYYHFYSGSKTASLKALHDVYDWALAQDVITKWASEYAQAVSGYRSAGMAATPDGGWKITDIGALRTLRIDRASGWPDMTRSKGVAGYLDIPQGRYVHLTGEDPAIVYLDTRQTTGGPYLHRANARIIKWENVKDARHIRLAGHDPVMIEIASAKKTCTLTIDNEAARGDRIGNIHRFSIAVMDTEDAVLECK